MDGSMASDERCARPLPATMNIRDARDHYLAENGFSLETYEERWADFWLFGLRLKIPNLPSRRRLLRMHDLHHVATGFGTDLVGEAEVSVWELRRGYRGLGLYCGFIVSLGAALGLLAPVRALAAWRAPGASPVRPSLYATERSYDELLTLSVGELRRELGLPEEGLAERPRALHVKAPRHA
jgi:hypothetical protein